MEKEQDQQKERILAIYTDGESTHVGVQWQGIYEVRQVGNPSDYPHEPFGLHEGDWVILQVWHLPSHVWEQVLRNISTHYPRVYTSEKNARKAMAKLSPPILQLPLALATLKDLLAKMEESNRQCIQIVFDGIRGQMNWEKGTIQEDHRFLQEWAQAHQSGKAFSFPSGGYEG